MNQTQVKADTERAKNKALAEVRRGRQENEMTGRIRKAWTQLDVAVDEIVRLGDTIKRAKREGDEKMAASFEKDLLVEKAKARGKAEILALIMPAPLNDPEAVSRESGVRYAARQKGVEHETPGLRMVGATVMDDIEGRPEFT